MLRRVYDTSRSRRTTAVRANWGSWIAAPHKIDRFTSTLNYLNQDRASWGQNFEAFVKVRVTEKNIETNKLAKHTRKTKSTHKYMCKTQNTHPVLGISPHTF